MHTGFCLIAFALIAASLYTMFVCESCPPFINYMKSLKPEQQELYAMIVDERKKIAMYGLALGVILGFVYLYFYKKSFNPFINGCTFVAIVLMTQYLFYMLMPKQSMLPHLEGKDQIDGWYNTYKFMQYRYHLGALIGVIGYFLFAYYICNY